MKTNARTYTGIACIGSLGDNLMFAKKPKIILRKSVSMLIQYSRQMLPFVPKGVLVYIAKVLMMNASATATVALIALASLGDIILCRNKT
jgi:hypothetical protein